MCLAKIMIGRPRSSGLDLVATCVHRLADRPCPLYYNTVPRADLWGCLYEEGGDMQDVAPGASTRRVGAQVSTYTTRSFAPLLLLGPFYLSCRRHPHSSRPPRLF